MSAFGHWSRDEADPSFCFTGDPRSSSYDAAPARHWLLVATDEFNFVRSVTEA